jgi:hypothetical protein
MTKLRVAFESARTDEKPLIVDLAEIVHLSQILFESKCRCITSRTQLTRLIPTNLGNLKYKYNWPR